MHVAQKGAWSSLPEIKEGKHCSCEKHKAEIHICIVQNKDRPPSGKSHFSSWYFRSFLPNIRSFFVFLGHFGRNTWHWQSSRNMPDMSGRLLLMSGRGLKHCQTFCTAWFNTRKMFSKQHNICWSLTEKNVQQGIKMSGRAWEACRTFCPAHLK